MIHAINTNKILVYGSEDQSQEFNLEVKGTRVWGHRQLDEHFIDCVLHNKRPSVTTEDAIKAIEAAQKMTKNLT